MISPQLTLSLQLQAGFTFSNFYTGASNLEGVSALKKWASGTGEPYLYLSGDSGSGRSHLLQACVHTAFADKKRAAYVPLRHFVTEPPETLQGFDAFDLVCMDDVQVIAGVNAWEEAVFHFFNRLHANQGRLLLSATAVPAKLGLALPDLASRLAWGVIYTLHPLRDDEKLTVLIKRAEERGIHLSEEVARFMLTHCPRHMRTLCAALDALDAASLAAQRRLTIPFVKAVLQI